MAKLTEQGDLAWYMASTRQLEEHGVPRRGGVTRCAPFSGGQFFLTLGDECKTPINPVTNVEKSRQGTRPAGYIEQFCRLEYHRKEKSVVIYEGSSGHLEPLLTAAGFESPVLFEVNNWINEMLQKEVTSTS